MDLSNSNEIDEEEQLLHEIELVMKDIYLITEKILNNQSLTELNDPIEKFLVSNYSYSLCLLDDETSDEVNGSENLLESLEDNMQEELDFLTRSLDRLIVQISEDKEMSLSLDSNISNLNAMIEASEKNTTNRSINEIIKNIKMRFKKEKSDLKTIIATIFADNFDIHDLIAAIIEHHFEEGPDKYLQLEKNDNIAEQIELLRRTELFEVNPHDILQIRLANLI